MRHALCSLRFAMQIDMKQYQAIVFDFDGVIVDSVEVKTDAFAELFKDFGPSMQARVVQHHRENGGMPRDEKIRHYYRHFIGKTIDQRQLKEMCQKFSSIVVDKVIAAPEIPGAEAFIKLATSETLCFINSATPDDEIVEIASRRGLTRFFREIFGSGHKKDANLRYILKSYKVDRHACLFFGDAASDLRAAQSCGVDFIGIVPSKEAPLLRFAPDIVWVPDFNRIIQ